MIRNTSFTWRLNHKDDAVKIVLLDGREVYVDAGGAFNVHRGSENIQVGAFAQGNITNTCPRHPEIGKFTPPAVCPKCAMESKAI